MGIDTYLVIPVINPETAAKQWPSDEEVIQRGADCLVVYCTERFRDVEASPEHWGPEYATSLPPAIRRNLDPRGLYAMAEVGQDYDGVCYAEIVAEGGIWLPIFVERPAKTDKERRLLLCTVSETQREALLEHPKTVRDWLKAKADSEDNDAVSLGPEWIALQQLLFEFLDTSDDNVPEEQVLPPKRGIPLYESRTIDRSRLTTATIAARLAKVVARVSLDDLRGLEVSRLKNPAARGFPQSLGSCPSDDHEDPPQDQAAVAAHSIEAALCKTRSLYRRAAENGLGILTIGYRQLVTKGARTK